MKVFSTILTLKGVWYLGLFMGVDVCTAEIYCEETHAFPVQNDLKIVSKNVYNTFNTMIKNYVSPVDRVYHS